MSKAGGLYVRVTRSAGDRAAVPAAIQCLPASLQRETEQVRTGPATGTMNR
jgi:hypothetical protein